MKFDPIDSSKFDNASSSDFHLLSVRFQKYIEAYNSLLRQGTPAQMLSSGFMWLYARQFMIFAFIPLTYSIIAILYQNTSLGFAISEQILALKNQHISFVKPIGAFIAILFVFAFGYFIWKPFNILGVWGGKQNKGETYTEMENEKEQLFFNQSFRSESGYNALFIYSILILFGLIGLVCLLVKVILGMLVITLVAGCAFLWFWYQSNSRPLINVTLNGDIELKYKVGKNIKFNVKDCDTINLEYYDSINYTRWNHRPLYSELNKALGTSSLFPNKIVFANKSAHAKIAIEFENLKSSQGVYFNPWETEYYFASLLNKNNFLITCNLSNEPSPYICVESWVAKRK